MRVISVIVAAFVFPTVLFAGDIAPRDGWVVMETTRDHATLLADLKKAVSKNKMGVVTQAGPTATARGRGITIPENRVIGVFNNDFAVKILDLSTAAMIEAPVRFYVTEEENGNATLSYKKPSFVFAPYADEGGAALQALARDLDARFEMIAADATK
ncbi:DUF302 domain-containing protein [Roseobacter ponti]|uniref:DUF302 domain-containing protein n=1 Tax=Roseobacter ponti TaxID=1891787 RepID=A0A858SWV7_9RHOB|nr:DUF302 domain-containing protein [Roseobacter ponti]QJF52760.1 DUF302 domain-containing protein [Roseobacter ponti]